MTGKRALSPHWCAVRPFREAGTGRSVHLMTAAFLAASSPSTAAETEVELRTRVISALRVVDVQPAPALVARYAGDLDPQTIEVVRLLAKSDGRSRVSEDGQVVYLGFGQSTSKHRELYLNRAFEIHFRKAREMRVRQIAAKP